MGIEVLKPVGVPLFECTRAQGRCWVKEEMKTEGQAIKRVLIVGSVI